MQAALVPGRNAGPLPAVSIHRAQRFLRLDKELENERVGYC